MRLIDGDKLIDIITNSADLGGVWGQVLKAVKDAFIRLIRTMPNVNPEPQWIPCSERLPEERQIVLATHLGGLDPSRQVIEHIYSGGKFLLNWEMDMEMHSPTFGQRYMGKVIAWMPLPEPWRGDAE